MRLTKTKLIKLVKPMFLELGYTNFKDSIEVSQGLFVKKISKDLYLTIGLTIDRYHDSLFTGAYYLSRTTSWASVWGDIPKECYERPGYFLTDEELMNYYKNKKERDTLPRDIWWDGLSNESALDFIQIIKLTEPRVINQPNLIDRIYSSEVVSKLYNQAQRVIKLATSHGSIYHDFDYQYVPSKEIDDIPLIWFMMSEILLTTEKELSKDKTINKNIILNLAADAYRQYKLRTS